MMRRGGSANGQPLRHVPGEVGIWVFIFGELAIFALFFAAYLVDRSSQADLYLASQQKLNPVYGVVNTLLLLTSSFLVVTGVRGVRQGQNALAQTMFGGAIACGLGFAALKFLEYREKFDAGITPHTNSFFTYYFMMTGIHFLHVVAGTGVLLILIRALRPDVRGKSRIGLIECGATYWHMVDLIWIILFPLLYLIR